MKSSGITAHMIVKNEDQWVWYAINSVLPYVDTFLICDTGSTDNTISLIKSIESPKIRFDSVLAKTRAEVTRVRSNQLKRTRTPWVWIVDADEVYPDKTAKECLNLTKNPQIEGVLVRRYDLLGDIYHRQIETVGSYNLFGHSGHLLVRLINLDRLKGLSYRGDYPLEGFYDKAGDSILTHKSELWAATQHYLYHAMYLKRSSLGSNLPMFNRSKYQIESGVVIEDEVPELLSHFPRRSELYEFLAKIITPIKNIKRKLL